jgi:UDP-N-acetylglucosamine--N-acetylmuramyl-(pentapeptide) pyrophosphoryl-undecaprenol N-acetylglucosamine transferase
MKIVFTGGGSAGHVTPNIALMPTFKAEGWQMDYIGSETGIERKLIEALAVPYHAVSSGKLRRYMDVKNFSDPLRLIKGIVQAGILLRKLKPNVVFSKGGFVAVPVIIGSWLNKIPVVIHESDMTPGLANKLSLPFATKVCVSFPETLKYIPQAVCTGTPIRQELLQGNADAGLAFCNFTKALPVLLVIGGSLGSEKINAAVRSGLATLTTTFQIIHLCGKGNVKSELATERYKQFDYVTAEMADILACASLVISRAGANSIFELLALRKPALLIPLSAAASRGDQILNAASFKKNGYAKVLQEESLTPESLVANVQELYRERETVIEKMNAAQKKNSVDEIVGIIKQVALNERTFV